MNRTTLNDELLAHRTFTTANLHSYNNRMHLHSASYKLEAPELITQQNQYLSRIASPVFGRQYSILKVFVYVRTDDGERIICRTVDLDKESDIACILFAGGDSIDFFGLTWFFYPDNRAYRAVIELNNKMAADLKLTEHKLLNGAYWSADGLTDPLPLYIQDYVEPEVSDAEVSAPHTVYVSEVNNPFVFTSQLTASIGCNEVYGLASAAKAMSSGQFGQFPLYAFTDNGVWALETSSTGSYTARQPITRDVCINAESITQMDGSVLFATARGIMEVSGSTSACISDNLEADDMFVPTNLPQIEALLKYVNQESSVVVDADVLKFVSFITFCAGCRMIYDYVQQRIIVYNPSYRYAYVFSLKSKTWGMMQSNIKLHANSYPEAIAMDNDGYLIDFNAATTLAADGSGSDTGEMETITGVNGLVVTRPMKFGLNDVHKTVDTILQRGVFKTGHVQSVLYASNNLFDWKAIWASNNECLRGMIGSPYKYFRVALICKLDKEESISGMTVRFEPRLTNRPR